MPIEANHIVIVGPGLGDSNWFLNKGVQSWAQYGIQTEVHEASWSRDDYQAIKQGLEDRIAYHQKRGKKVAFVGISAFGSFIGTKGFSAAVNICGRLRSGQNSFFVQQMAEGRSLAHEQAVESFEHEIEPLMTGNQRRNVLVVKPMWDDTVPVKTMVLKGAFELNVKMLGHVPSIYFALYKKAPEICRFLSERLAG